MRDKTNSERSHEHTNNIGERDGANVTVSSEYSEVEDKGSNTFVHASVNPFLPKSFAFGKTEDTKV